MEEEISLEIIEQHSNTSTPTLSAKLGHSQITMNQPLHKLSFENRHCRELSNELCMIQRGVNMR